MDSDDTGTSSLDHFLAHDSYHCSIITVLWDSMTILIRTREPYDPVECSPSSTESTLLVSPQMTNIHDYWLITVVEFSCLCLTQAALLLA